MTWWSNKIAQELENLTGYGTSGYALTSTGAGSPPTWQSVTGAAAPSVIARVAPIIRVNSTGSPTSALGGAKTIPAGTLGTNGGVLRLHLFGNNLNNTGSSRSFAIDLQLNGVSLLTDSTAAYATGANRRPYQLTLLIARVDATHATATAFYMFGASSAATVGIGDFSTASSNADTIVESADGGVAGVAWGSSQSLDVLITPSASSSSLEWCTDGGVVEALP